MQPTDELVVADVAFCRYTLPEVALAKERGVHAVHLQAALLPFLVVIAAMGWVEGAEEPPLLRPSAVEPVRPRFAHQGSERPVRAALLDQLSEAEALHFLWVRSVVAPVVETQK